MSSMNGRAIARWLRTGLQRIWLRLLSSVRLSVEYSRANMKLFALFEILGQPIYFILWKFIYPQPHENLELRLACILLSLPMLFEQQMQGRLWRRVLPVYWIVFLVFELPFFFIYMSLINNFSSLWAISTMAAVMVMVILVYDWLMSLLLAFIGAGAAWLVFEASGGMIVDPPLPVAALFWIYLFGLASGTAFNYKTELVAREKLSAITDAVGTMAHELRTPLLGIRSGARGLNNYIPTLIQGYQAARDHGLDVPMIRRAHFEQISAVLNRIESETEYTGAVLDMLLVNSSRTAIDSRSFERVSINQCVDEALDRYPFHSTQERALVEWRAGDDFVFQGTHVLMVHVLFNLLKNALYQLARSGRGRISIWSLRRRGERMNELHFRDTGPGIPAATLPRIFDRFYSGMPRGQGTGIGLAFARVVIESFYGQIICQSVEGEYAEFIIRLPDPQDL
ncbi:HAMP domain-containing sensor histidine kinase [Salinisphaera sp. Q1T1-3]|uniref:sensor histidine kinase n=1 Tax=Salinisphaera sp. Q1T1-3 TaxID=2321229 RepID=UPI000E714C79|nr:HAMP domain-containing sensor histidine kinase [Salinisphaera sp. Q1T1-3]RJS95079.1 sensor histidine kinase [Salinisphaera sp. Q1T1-3]